MPKRKSPAVDDEEFSASEEASSASSREGSGKDRKKQKQYLKDTLPAKKKIKEEIKEEEDGPSDKLEHSEDEQASGKVLIHVTGEGDKYIDLGKKKRAVVRSFKGVPLIDIREFYGADGQEKPGKKGIALTLEQWQMLKEGTSAIDKLLASQAKK